MKGALRSFIFSRHGQHLVRPIGPIHSKQHDTHLFPFGIGVHAPVQCRGCEAGEAGEAGDSDSDGGGGSGFSIGDSVASCLFCGPVISTVMLSPVVGGLSGISPPFHDVSCFAEVDNQWRRCVHLIPAVLILLVIVVATIPVMMTVIIIVVQNIRERRRDIVLELKFAALFQSHLKAGKLRWRLRH